MLLAFCDKDNLSNNILFQRIGDVVLYNNELNDTVYAFSADDGECVKSYYTNFDKRNIPQEYKYDFEKLWEEGKEKPFFCFSQGRGMAFLLYFDRLFCSAAGPYG